MSRKMSPKVAKEAGCFSLGIGEGCGELLCQALKLSEPLEPTAQSKAKPAKAPNSSAESRVHL